MEAFGSKLRQEADLQTLTADVLKNSEIEGEILEKEQVRASVARHLGMDIGALKAADRHVEGIVELRLDATRQFGQPLTDERLFRWHTALFAMEPGRMSSLKVGAWRDDSAGPMQVVSGPVGKERVRFEAPAAARLGREMYVFLYWFNGPPDIDEVLKAGLAHLWFATIHPFDAGNGRIARAIADMSLARSEKSPQRFYSISEQIAQERDAYFDILEQTQKGTLDVTRWLTWFLGCMGRAIENAQSILESVLARARFWERAREASLNDRQILILNQLFEGFEGKLTTSMYAKRAKCSQDTALRDIVSLADRGILVRSPAGGRSTSYALPEEPHRSCR